MFSRNCSYGITNWYLIRFEFCESLNRVKILTLFEFNFAIAPHSFKQLRFRTRSTANNFVNLFNFIRVDALFWDKKKRVVYMKMEGTLLARWPWTRCYRRIIISFYWPNAWRVPRFARKTRVYDEKNEQPRWLEAVNPVRGREQCSSGGHCLHFLIARHSYKIFAYHWWIRIKRLTNTTSFLAWFYDHFWNTMIFHSIFLCSTRIIDFLL